MPSTISSYLYFLWFIKFYGINIFIPLSPKASKKKPNQNTAGFHQYPGDISVST